LQTKNILLIGDSLVEYGDWQSWLTPYKAINLGVAGETVEGLYERLPYIVEQFANAWIFVFMSGINNVAVQELDFLPLYRQIIRYVKTSSSLSYIIVCSLLPVNVEFISNSQIKKINIKLSDICEQENVYFLDIFEEFLNPDNTVKSQYLLSDGIHLSRKGYRKWCQKLKETIKALER